MSAVLINSFKIIFLADSPRTPTCSNLDFSNIAITPNRYEKMYRSQGERESDNCKTGKNILGKVERIYVFYMMCLKVCTISCTLSNNVTLLLCTKPTTFFSSWQWCLKSMKCMSVCILTLGSK